MNRDMNPYRGNHTEPSSSNTRSEGGVSPDSIVVAVILATVLCLTEWPVLVDWLARRILGFAP